MLEALWHVHALFFHSDAILRNMATVVTESLHTQIMFSAKIKKELEKSSNNNTELQLRRQSTHTNCTNDQSTLRKLSKHINQPRNTMKLVEFYNFFLSARLLGMWCGQAGTLEIPIAVVYRPPHGPLTSPGTSFPCSSMAWWKLFPCSWHRSLMFAEKRIKSDWRDNGPWYSS